MEHGPLDLSARLGHPGVLNHPEVATAMLSVVAVCARAGKPAGLFRGEH
jgi:2-keto-3-deoxy-L-rhamnonate aldolase RhmA